MKIKYSDYLTYNIPKDWIVETEDNITSIYKNDGYGAITMSSYTIFDNDKPLDLLIGDMISKFISDNKIQIKGVIIINIANKNKKVAYAEGKAEDNSYVKIWIVAKFPKAILVTYYSDKKTREIKEVDKIVDSFKFIGL